MFSFSGSYNSCPVSPALGMGLGSRCDNLVISCSLHFAQFQVPVTSLSAAETSFFVEVGGMHLAVSMRISIAFRMQLEMILV